MSSTGKSAVRPLFQDGRSFGVFSVAKHAVGWRLYDGRVFVRRWQSRYCTVLLVGAPYRPSVEVPCRCCCRSVGACFVGLRVLRSVLLVGASRRPPVKVPYGRYFRMDGRLMRCPSANKVLARYCWSVGDLSVDESAVRLILSVGASYHPSAKVYYRCYCRSVGLLVRYPSTNTLLARYRWSVGAFSVGKSAVLPYCWSVRGVVRQ